MSIAEHRFGGDWTEEKLSRLHKYLKAYRLVFTQNEKHDISKLGMLMLSPALVRESHRVPRLGKHFLKMFTMIRKRQNTGMAAPKSR